MEITFEQYKLAVHEYINKYCIKKGFAVATVKRKKEIFTRLELFLNGRPFNIDNIELFKDYLYANGWNQASSKATLVNWLRAFVTWCYKYADLFEKNWAFKIIKPTVPRKKWLLLSEQNALRVITSGCEPTSKDDKRTRKSKNEHLLGMQFILLHGFRIGEVIAMKGSDIRLESDIPYVRLRKPKSQQEEWMPVHTHFVPILRERINNSKLFSVTEKTCNKLLRKGVEKLRMVGYDVTVHRLRYIYALSRLRKQPNQLVSRSLRHDSFRTTDLHYSHYDLSDINQVVQDSNVLQSEITPAEFL